MMLLNSTEVFGTPRHLVMDPVHGGIPYFTHEQKVIDHPLFQRLRHIKQNDILHFVFPGATHSRFEHCLGTMHISGLIFRSMLRNYLINRDKLVLKKDQLNAIQYCYGCLRLAALLHDVGHMPFSHQFENAEAGKKMLSNKSIIRAMWSSDYSFLIDKEPSELKHEHYSIRAGYEILNGFESDPSFPFRPNDIIGMMEGGCPPPSNLFCKNAYSTLTLLMRNNSEKSSLSRRDIGPIIRNLFKDIISGEIDADKMDYLLRDSYFSGCNYGAYNIDHLVKNICVGFDINASSTTKPWVGIAIYKKGLGALEDFVQSRFRMYLQVYGHKTVVGFKWLVREAVAEILRDRECHAFVEKALSNMEIFADFTDTFCWEAFRKYALTHPSSACSDLLKREKLHHVAQIDDQVDFEKDHKRIQLEKDYNKKMIQHECPSRFSKINPSFAKMRLLVKDSKNKPYHLSSIASQSTFFSKFQDVTVTHYYEKPSWKD